MKNKEIQFQSVVEDIENVINADDLMEDIQRLKEQGLTEKEALRLYSLEATKEALNFYGFKGKEKQDYDRLKKKSLRQFI